MHERIAWGSFDPQLVDRQLPNIEVSSSIAPNTMRREEVARHFEVFPSPSRQELTVSIPDAHLRGKEPRWLPIGSLHRLLGSIEEPIWTHVETLGLLQVRPLGDKFALGSEHLDARVLPIGDVNNCMDSASPSASSSSSDHLT